MQVNVNYKYGMDFPINQPEFANGYEYAAALNEALYYDGLEMQYTRNELDAFKNGHNRDLYANSDWLGEGFQNIPSTTKTSTSTSVEEEKTYVTTRC